MSEKRKPAGLILSAGLSSRMHDFKPLMKIGGKTALEILIGSMKHAGIEDIFVVVGYKSDVLEKYLSDKGVEIIVNDDYEQGMFTSVKAGIRAAKKNSNDCVLMTPVDIPLIPPYIFKAVMKRFYDADASGNSGGSRFAVACSGGRKGHPLCIPAAFYNEILADPGEKGLKSVTERYEDSFIKVDTHCESILLDMDTQEAYENILDFYEKHRYPTEEQCWKIYDRVETPEHVIRHCLAVTDTAMTIAGQLNSRGYSLSLPLIKAAGMLHDSLRVMKKHWDAGADLCLDYGYPEAADIIRVHMNYMHPDPVVSINETDIICLADKLRQEDRLVTLEERLAPVRIRWKDNPEALAVISRRIACADGMRRYIEDIIGENLYEILRRADEEKKAHEGDGGAGRRVVLIRHGETEKHREKIFLGQTDVPMSDEGRDQIDHVGIEMKHFNIDTDRIYCSCLDRAHESADIIASHFDRKVEVTGVPEFNEMNMGSWDGLFISQIKSEFPEAYEARGKDLVNYKIDENAESFVDLKNRVIPRFRRLIDETEGDIVIVSHSGVNRVIKAELKGKSLDEAVKMKFGRGTYEFFEIKA